jgi:hypothetical protein
VIIDQARQADAAAFNTVADRIRDLSHQLRQARTAQGLAVETGDPTGARTADQQVGQLTSAVARLEGGHQRRERWRTLTPDASPLSPIVAGRFGTSVLAPKRRTRVHQLQQALLVKDKRLPAGDLGRNATGG